MTEANRAKFEKISHHFLEIIKALGLDLDDQNLTDTNKRVAKLYLEMFHGLEEGSEPAFTTFPNKEKYSSMVFVRDIPFYSMCSHHFVPFYGKAHMGYIPQDRILGISKLGRLLEFYAKRPQLQERLTEQCVDYLWRTLQPLGAIVVVEAHHLCMEMRGIKKPGSLTVTSAIRGCFEDKAVREEFLDLLARPSW